MTRDANSTGQGEGTGRVAGEADYAAYRAMTETIHASMTAAATFNNRLDSVRLLRRITAELEEARRHDKELADELDAEGDFGESLRGVLAGLEGRLFSDPPRSPEAAAALAGLILDGILDGGKYGLGPAEAGALARCFEVMRPAKAA